jgi:hypothetical protein
MANAQGIRKESGATVASRLNGVEKFMQHTEYNSSTSRRTKLKTSSRSPRFVFRLAQAEDRYKSRRNIVGSGQTKRNRQ